MATRAQKLRLSIFLIATGSILAIALLVLVGGRLLRRFDGYVIEYRDVSVSGLEAGAPVKYHGVQVGRVSDLSVKDPETIAVSIEVRHGTPIKRDTQGVLSNMGITGQKFVELVGGTSEAGALEPGGKIPAGVSTFQAISDRAEAILEKTENLLNNANRLLDPKTTDAIQRLLVASANVAEQTDRLLADNRLDTALTHLATASARVDSAMERVSSLAGRVGTEMDSMQLAQTMAELRDFLNNSNKMVTHGDLLLVQARGDVLRSLTNMEEVLDNLREATDIIRENPSVLIRGRQGGDRVEGQGP